MFFYEIRSMNLYLNKYWGTIKYTKESRRISFSNTNHTQFSVIRSILYSIKNLIQKNINIIYLDTKKMEYYLEMFFLYFITIIIAGILFLKYAI